MGRMHSNGKGKSRSTLPYRRSPPSWLKITNAEVRVVHVARSRLLEAITRRLLRRSCYYRAA